MLFGAVYLTHAMIQDVRSLDKGDITRSALQLRDDALVRREVFRV